MYLNTFEGSLENDYMFRPDDETGSDYIEDLILEGKIIFGEYDDEDDEETN